jgi:predicted flap endonuclease-1-like 5' DNA nuclease
MPWTTAGNTLIAIAASKKRTFRYLWQARINAAARTAGITYSRLIEGLKAAKCELDRKVIADIAAQDNAAFLVLVKLAQDSLQAKAQAPKVTEQDLTQIEGIGPKIKELFYAQGIKSFAQIAATPVGKLKEILAAGGSRFKQWDPTTWPEQAALAAKGDWEAFEKLKKNWMADAASSFNRSNFQRATSNGRLFYFGGLDLSIGLTFSASMAKQSHYDPAKTMLGRIGLAGLFQFG